MDEHATPPSTPKYRRVVLKLSGEGFGYPGKAGIGIEETLKIGRQAKRIGRSGVQLAIVVGGGNILRGASSPAAARLSSRPPPITWACWPPSSMAWRCKTPWKASTAQTRLQTAIRMETVAEPYIRRRCMRHLEKGRIVILAGGTGNPFVTTDTAAALRARELEADILLKATRVDGIYSEDPEINPHAVRYEKLTYAQVIRDRTGGDGHRRHRLCAGTRNCPSWCSISSARETSNVPSPATPSARWSATDPDLM